MEILLICYHCRYGMRSFWGGEGGRACLISFFLLRSHLFGFSTSLYSQNVIHDNIRYTDVHTCTHVQSQKIYLYIFCCHILFFFFKLRCARLPRALTLNIVCIIYSNECDVHVLVCGTIFCCTNEVNK